MSERYEAFLEKYVAASPSTTREVTTLESELGISLPDDYRTFLLNRGRGEGFFGRRYLLLYSADQILPFNHDYETSKHAPGLLLFGTDGGGEGFAFDLREASYHIVIVPLIGMSLNDAKRIASTFTDFLEKLSQPDVKLF